MGRGRKRRGRPISGLLLLDKPQGVTSNGALQEAKRLFYAQKAGHTGSLDPMATGVLPVCFGEATKFSQYLLNAEKSYRAVVVLGAVSDTADADGNVVWQSDTHHIQEAEIVEAVDALLGVQMQVPPMYSALKVNGERLYDLARDGIEVEREAREITVHEIQLEQIKRSEVGNFQLSKACQWSADNDQRMAQIQMVEVEISLSVSKGTYIRSLAEELGKQLGVGAYLGGLIRTRVGDFELDEATTMDELRDLKASDKLAEMDELLIDTASCLSHMPLVTLDDHSGFYLKNGNPVQVSGAPLDGEVCLRMESGQFVGVGVIDDNGRVAPKRLVNFDAEGE